jgi:hypothetical protein
MALTVATVLAATVVTRSVTCPMHSALVSTVLLHAAVHASMASGVFGMGYGQAGDQERSQGSRQGQFASVLKMNGHRFSFYWGQ